MDADRLKATVMFISIGVALYSTLRLFLASHRAFKARQDRAKMMLGAKWIENTYDCAILARDLRVANGGDPEKLGKRTFRRAATRTSSLRRRTSPRTGTPRCGSSSRARRCPC